VGTVDKQQKSQQLLEQTSGNTARSYWAGKTHFRGMDIKSIDWQTIHHVVNGMTITQQRWTTKFTTSLCAMGHMMYRWGKHQSAGCPQCGAEFETMAHILHSGSGSASNQRSKYP